MVTVTFGTEQEYWRDPQWLIDLIWSIRCSSTAHHRKGKEPAFELTMPELRHLMLRYVPVERKIGSRSVERVWDELKKPGRLSEIDGKEIAVTVTFRELFESLENYAPIERRRVPRK